MGSRKNKKTDMVEEKSTVATHSMVTPTCVDAP
jgi:hypothetical protein